MNGTFANIQELESLSSDSIFSISKIEWWLLKYKDEYLKAKQMNSSRHLYKIDWRVVRLPDNIGNPTDEEKFIDVYESLDNLSKLHRNENYYKQEMAIYKGIENEPFKVKQWLKKNEKLGAEDYVCFLTDYLDYDTDVKVNHLSIFFLNNEELEVYVDKDNFKYTIEFLETFNKLYWI